MMSSLHLPVVQFAHDCEAFSTEVKFALILDQSSNKPVVVGEQFVTHVEQIAPDCGTFFFLPIMEYGNGSSLYLQVKQFASNCGALSTD